MNHFILIKNKISLKILLPYVHKRPVKPSVQLHINDSYEFPYAQLIVGIHTPYTHGFCAQ